MRETRHAIREVLVVAAWIFPVALLANQRAHARMIPRE